MKKNIMMRIASFLLVAVIVTSCAVSGTFAKYVSEVSGTATASVAQWKFTSGESEKNLAVTKTFTFALFDTIKDTVDEGTNVESDVAEDKIAPGTQGSFEIQLTNASEVNATYGIVFSDNNADSLALPIEYKINDGEWQTAFENVNGNINMGDEVAVTVEWRWAFTNTAGDEADTDDGIAAVDSEEELSVTAEVSLIQVD